MAGLGAAAATGGSGYGATASGRTSRSRLLRLPAINSKTLFKLPIEKSTGRCFIAATRSGKGRLVQLGHESTLSSLDTMGPLLKNEQLGQAAMQIKWLSAGMHVLRR
ncbi:hypothetical protein OEZ86_012505 [Tetradesmus obliquus]|nr:hypothetical protein OEZ86_012505 [Tetradesmus obliquus]